MAYIRFKAITLDIEAIKNMWVLHNNVININSINGNVTVT